MSILFQVQLQRRVPGSHSSGLLRSEGKERQGYGELKENRRPLRLLLQAYVP